MHSRVAESCSRSPRFHALVCSLSKFLIANSSLAWLIDVKKEKYQTAEVLRKASSTIHAWITDAKIETINIVDADGKAIETLAFAEGLALSNYQFLKYKKDREIKKNFL